ncbi:MAG TPA: hypothetical protein VH761_02090, partial [Ilumatobacteraceae bacterium]
MRARISGVRLLVVGVLVLGACSGSKGTSSTTVPATTVAPVASTAAAPTTTAAGDVVTPSALWALTRTGDLLHLDPFTADVLGTSKFSDAAEAFAGGAYAAGNLWLAVYQSPDLLRISTADGSVQERVPGDLPCCIVGNGDELWTADAEQSVVSRHDPATGELAQEIAVDEPIGRVVIGSDADYVLLDKSDKVLRIDSDGTIAASASVPDLNIFGAFTDMAVWVNDHKGVIALDPTTLEQTSRVDGVFPNDLVGDDGALWVSDAADAIERIDAATGEVTQWAQITDPDQIELAGDWFYVLDKDGRIWLGSTTDPGLRALAGTPKGISQLVYTPAHHSDGSPAVEEPPTTVPTTEPPGTPVPAGVLWNAVDLPSDAEISVATRAVSTDGGVVAIGRETQTDGGQPVLWVSSDGTSFTRADTTALSPPSSHIGINDVAGANGVIVAVGSQGSSCEVNALPDFGSACPRQDGVAWFTADGQTWHAGTSTDNSFVDGLVTALDDVAVTSAGFVAVGHVYLDRTTWQLGVWTSVDGQAWTRTALIADPSGVLSRPSLGIAGSTLFIAARVTRCEAPFEVFGGFGFTDPTANGRAYTSTNAVDWAPVDLVAAGL